MLLVACGTTIRHHSGGPEGSSPELTVVAVVYIRFPEELRIVSDLVAGPSLAFPFEHDEP
jgi:hypothetical protein